MRAFDSSCKTPETIAALTVECKMRHSISINSSEYHALNEFPPKPSHEGWVRKAVSWCRSADLKLWIPALWIIPAVALAIVWAARGSESDEGIEHASAGLAVAFGLLSAVYGFVVLFRRQAFQAKDDQWKYGAWVLAAFTALLLCALCIRLHHKY